MIASIYSVGDRVRVNDIKNCSTKCAMIACCNSDATYDVLYDTRSDDCSRETDEEEVSVKPARVAKLLPFEMTSLSELQPLQAKDYGNIMFKLEDLDSATGYYKSALKSLLRSEKVDHKSLLW